MNFSKICELFPKIDEHAGGGEGGRSAALRAGERGGSTEAGRRRARGGRGRRRAASRARATAGGVEGAAETRRESEKTRIGALYL